MKDMLAHAALAGLAGAFISILTLPLARAWFRRRGWVDAPGVRKIHVGVTPLAGGLSVLLGLLGGLALVEWGFRSGALRSPAGIPGLENPAWRLAAAAGSLYLLGWWDDVVELRPLGKFCGQLTVALLVVGSGVRLPWFPASPTLQVLSSACFFMAVVNAVNFLDNMNGLCAGLGCIAAIQLGLICGRAGQPALAVACWGMAGACGGFLPYNYPKASAFLGDSGSHVVGGGIAVLTMLASRAVAGQPGGGWGAEWTPLWVLVVPGYDLIQVVIGRLRRGQPFYLGDNHHVSHQLARRGLGRATAVLVLWMVAVMAGCIGVWLSW